MEGHNSDEDNQGHLLELERVEKRNDFNRQYLTPPIVPVELKPYLLTPVLKDMLLQKGLAAVENLSTGTLERPSSKQLKAAHRITTTQTVSQTFQLDKIEQGDISKVLANVEQQPSQDTSQHTSDSSDSDDTVMEADEEVENNFDRSAASSKEQWISNNTDFRTEAGRDFSDLETRYWSGLLRIYNAYSKEYKNYLNNKDLFNSRVDSYRLEHNYYPVAPGPALESSNVPPPELEHHLYKEHLKGKAYRELKTADLDTLKRTLSKPIGRLLGTEEEWEKNRKEDELATEKFLDRLEESVMLYRSSKRQRPVQRKKQTQNILIRKDETMDHTQSATHTMTATTTTTTKIRARQTRLGRESVIKNASASVYFIMEEYWRLIRRQFIAYKLNSIRMAKATPKSKSKSNLRSAYANSEMTST